MEVKATAKTLRIPPRKARLVLDLIRGKDVEEAAAILRFTPNFMDSIYIRPPVACQKRGMNTVLFDTIANCLHGLVILHVERMVPEWMQLTDPNRPSCPIFMEIRYLGIGKFASSA